MKVIALTSTYPAQQLCEADAVVSSLREITVSTEGSAPKQLVRISVPEL
jgi:hypothetical protein